MNQRNEQVELDDLVKSSYRNVVAVSPRNDGTAISYVRNEDGTVESREIPFRPFLVVTDPSLLDSFEHPVDIESLQGEHPYRFKAAFENLDVYSEAVSFLKKSTGYNATAANAPYILISDYAQQLFTQLQFRLFRGMTFSDIHRLQFDIETVTSEGFEFTNPKRPDDQIVIITLSDNRGWEKCLSADQCSEKALLEQFVTVISERDPDVIEGHNLFRFDLPFIKERAKRHKVKLTLGRDGSEISYRNSRFSAAERTINYPRFDIEGRHIVDTYHLVQLYDVSHRDLEEYGLKAVAKHFGVAAPDRTYVDGSEITQLWSEDRETLIRYALDDVRETKAIAEILEPSYFYQTQMLPLSYQNCVVRGNATRIDGMLTAEYLSQSRSLPNGEKSRQFAGGLTKAFEAGVFKNVWHCDIRSLYPSIIIAEGWCPRRDDLSVFPRFLQKLRMFRLNAKDAEKSATNGEERDYYNSLQTTFKILINSFYGYLGFSQGRFNDFEMAERVTAKGRAILTSMLDFLNDAGANVIEMDTDGIYFQPPQGTSDPASLESKIQAVLPDGIDVELDAMYPAMFCYKSKNYALQHDNGEISITGAALKSRGLEPFQREFIKAFITLLLDEDFQGIHQLAHDWRQAIEKREWPLAKLAKSETLNDSPETYKRKMASGKGRRSAAYELVIQSERNYRQGDQVSFYVTGTKKRVSVVENSRLLADAPEERDENIAYYLAKLDELEKKFQDFIPGPDNGAEQLELF